MFESCLSKQKAMKKVFSACPSKEDKYNKILELAAYTRSLDPEHKIPENIVRGCQSTVYLYTYMKDGKLFFKAESDALISSGLSVLLTDVYSGETPETILKCPPTYLEELGIPGILTPTRANGLMSMHLRMQQDALKFLQQTLKK